MRKDDFHVLYDRLRTRDGWRFIEDLSFQTTATLDPDATQPQEIKVTFDNVNLDIGRVPGNLGAFLVLRHLYIAVKKNRVYHNALKGYSWESGSHLVVSNAVNDVFTGGITGGPFAMTNLKKFIFNTVPAGITIKKFEIKTPSQSNWADLTIANITAGGTVIDMESYFGTVEGFPSHSRNVTGQGIDIRITADNNVGDKTYIYTAYGTGDTSQSASWIVQYRDINGKKHNLGTFDDLKSSDNMVIDRITTLIADPTNTDYGSFLFTSLIQGQDYYNTGDIYSITANFAVAYMK